MNILHPDNKCVYFAIVSTNVGLSMLLSNLKGLVTAILTIQLGFLQGLWYKVLTKYNGIHTSPDYYWLNYSLNIEHATKLISWSVADTAGVCCMYLRGK